MHLSACRWLPRRSRSMMGVDEGFECRPEWVSRKKKKKKTQKSTRLFLVWSEVPYLSCGSTYVPVQLKKSVYIFYYPYVAKRI